MCGGSDRALPRSIHACSPQVRFSPPLRGAAPQQAWGAGMLHAPRGQRARGRGGAAGGGRGGTASAGWAAAPRSACAGGAAGGQAFGGGEGVDAVGACPGHAGCRGGRRVHFTPILDPVWYGKADWPGGGAHLLPPSCGPAAPPPLLLAVALPHREEGGRGRDALPPPPSAWRFALRPPMSAASSGCCWHCCACVLRVGVAGRGVASSRPAASALRFLVLLRLHRRDRLLPTGRFSCCW